MYVRGFTSGRVRDRTLHGGVAQPKNRCKVLVLISAFHLVPTARALPLRPSSLNFGSNRRAATVLRRVLAMGYAERLLTPADREVAHGRKPGRDKTACRSLVRAPRCKGCHGRL